MQKYLITIVFLPLFLFSVSIHEYSHGWVASKLGDNTAKLRGRLTLNPIKHISLLLTIVLPVVLALITWGRFAIGSLKPVPINPMLFRNPKRGLSYVGLAGPLSNFFTALVFASFLKILPYSEEGIIAVIRIILSMAVLANFILGLFNLIPVPPLDGSRIVAGIVPNKLTMFILKSDKYGIIFLVSLLAAIAIWTDNGIFGVIRIPLKYLWKFYGLKGVEFDNFTLGLE